jgi:glycine/D-amino acid oxidase-like deaminating enzyme
VRHTTTGYWLEEAGPVEPAPPLQADASADVVIVGGGYLGLWTAWHLRRLEPGLDVVVLEAALCGHGPSGRNGGFVSTLWGDLPTMRDRFGDERALAVGRASAESVSAIGAWCREQGIDAWFHEAPHLEVATTRAQEGVWHPVVRACREAGVAEEVRELDAGETRAICASPVFRSGALFAAGATVQPARLALGLRARLLAAGVRIHERSAVTSLSHDAIAETAGGRVRAGAAVLAVNTATAGWPGFRTALAVASSHIVLTEPVPDVLEELGWTGGEAIADCRTLLHYGRTTPDGRIAFGWGGGTMGFGGRAAARLEVDPDVIEHTRGSLLRFVPQLAGRRITHAWGGPIDVSPTHLPVFGTRGRAHHGYGFTGNGVGPSELGGRILARLALDRRDDVSTLALVEPEGKRFPPEPLRYAGGALIRRALVRKDAREDLGLRPDPLTALVASLPRRLGLHLPR